VGSDRDRADLHQEIHGSEALAALESQCPGGRCASRSRAARSGDANDRATARSDRAPHPRTIRVRIAPRPQRAYTGAGAVLGAIRHGSATAPDALSRNRAIPTPQSGAVTALEIIF